MTFNFDFSYWNWAEIRSLKQRLAQMGVPIVLDFHVCGPSIRPGFHEHLLSRKRCSRLMSSSFGTIFPRLISLRRLLIQRNLQLYPHIFRPSFLMGFTFPPSPRIRMYSQRARCSFVVQDPLLKPFFSAARRSTHLGFSGF